MHQQCYTLEAGHLIECITHQGHLIAFLHFMTLCPFNLILIGGQGIMMDYPSAKFGDFSFSCFGSIVRTDRQNHRFADVDDHYTHMTTPL